MQLQPTPIPGCFVIAPTMFEDERGRFVKVFHESQFAEHGLVASYAEEYYSVSRNGVLRGMHFQRPPFDHVKVVLCTAGRVLDAVVDLRRGSPTYGGHISVELSAARGNMLYIPRGLAHGFFVPDGEATLVYKVETVHAPTHDAGIAWNDCGVVWPTTNPILSPRDRGFRGLSEFDSPFRFDPERRP